MKVRQLVAVAVTPIAVLTACGGSGKSSSKAASSTTTVAASATPTTVSATKGGEFCQLVAASINTAQSNTSSPAGLKAALQGAQAKGEQALGQAPSDIKADLQVLVNVEKQLNDALAKVNYDASKMDPNTAAQFNTPQIQTASQHVVAWVKDHCGITVPGS